MFYNDLGTILRDARKRSKLTQDEVAKRMGLTNQNISSWELGKSKIDMNQLAVICSIYGLNMAEVMTNAVKEKPAPASEDELSAIDKELISLLRQLSPEQSQRVIDFVRGLLAARHE